MTWIVCALLLLSLLIEPALGKKKKRKRRRSAQRVAPPESALAHGASISLPGVAPASGGRELAIQLPAASSSNAAGRMVSSARELMPHVSHAYETVVEPHQAGLTDARETALEAVPLSANEA